MPTRQRQRRVDAARKELAYVVVALGSLAVGIGAVWLLQSVVDIEGDAVLVALLVIPLLTYLVLSGRVQEFGAGSVNVKLREVSTEPVSGVRTEFVAVDLSFAMDPHSPAVKTNPNQAKVIVLRLGGGPYSREECLQRLGDIALVPFLIVLDQADRVIAYMTHRSALDLLSRPERGDLFVELVNEGDPRAFETHPFSAVKTKTLPSNATNAEALEMMEETNLDELVVVDRRERFEGIIERDRVLSRMMLALVGSPTPET